jgi:hypothetical protein
MGSRNLQPMFLAGLLLLLLPFFIVAPSHEQSVTAPGIELVFEDSSADLPDAKDSAVQAVRSLFGIARGETVSALAERTSAHLSHSTFGFDARGPPQLV